VTIYILDWQGTLDSLAYPKGFVRALQHLGHKVVLYTGYSDLRHPAAAACDRYVVKGDSFSRLVNECLHDWPDATKVIYSDDERWSAKEMVEDLATDPDFNVDIEYLDPSHLGSHLSSLA
jgi:hypothetical protein